MNKIGEVRDLLKQYGIHIISTPDLAQQIDSLYTPENGELEELRTIFDLRYKADMRAIRMWREGHPERDLRQPDHADMVCWLLDRLDEFESKLKQEIMEHLPQELNAKAAISHCKPLIEAQTRKEIGKWLDDNKQLEQCDRDTQAFFIDYYWFDRNDFDNFIAQLKAGKPIEE